MSEKHTLDKFYKKVSSFSKKNNYEDFLILSNEFSNLKDLFDDLSLKNDFLLQENKNLYSKLNNLEKEFINFKNDNSEKFNSYYDIFSLLLIDYDLKPKGTFKYIQILSQELLNLVVNICEKYSLNYWLDYGTLLGALRHGGFIPWDDDIDLGMMRCDVNIFLDVISYELKKIGLDNCIQVNRDRINVNGDNIGFIQIFYMPDKSNVLSSVDIFTYDFIKTFDDSTQEIFYKEQHSFHSKIKKGISRDEAEKDYFFKLNISHKKQDFIIPGIDGYRNEYTYGFDLLETSMIFPLNNIKFNERVYSCPKNCDYYLKSIYGNYMDIPKKIHHHNRKKFIKNVSNIDEILKEEIKKVKNINEDFY